MDKHLGLAIIPQCACVHAKSLPTLRPIWVQLLWTVARQAPLSMGFSRQEYRSGLPCPPPGDLPNPGLELNISYIFPCWQAGSLPLVPPETPSPQCGTLLMGILCSEAFFLLVEVLSNLCHVLSLSLLSSAFHVPTTTDPRSESFLCSLLLPPC